MATDENILKFCPFSSNINSSFWHRLCELKLDVDMLEEKIRLIRGFYSFSMPGNLCIDCSSFSSSFESVGSSESHGCVINKNTIESFRQCDKTEILERHGGEILWDDIVSGKCLENPQLLSRFILLTYADLKNYKFYYWFAFVAPNITCNLAQKPTTLANTFSDTQVSTLTDLYLKTEDKVKSFCIVKVDNENCELVHLQNLQIFKCKLCDPKSTTNGIYLGFTDSTFEEFYPGWPLRNFLLLVSHFCPELVGKEVQVICFRLSRDSSPPRHSTLKTSLVLTVKLPAVCIQGSSAASVHGDGGEDLKWIGWEKNERGKFGPRKVNLKSSMDPKTLSESSVDLNLKLMKWRLLPSLDLEVVRNCKCLLLGAGTLGCSVARTLLGWGVRTITFVDNGEVSYSNPVRQSLFTYEDCLHGGKSKSVAASDALRKIFPGVESSSYNFTIPMPGHPIGSQELDAIKANVETLEELISQHDVMFLLMDSRESRWLPTMIGASKGKLVMNAALGFESYLVMRHGIRQIPINSEDSGSCLDSRLGCYFCNDVTAPGNSQHDRTLDQQCTVTRPGLSAIAGALVVELMVSVLQHPSKGIGDTSTESSDKSEGPLGIIPHSIRGFLPHFEQVLPSTPAFSKCIGCSETILNEYEKHGFDFLLKTFNCPNYLEDLSGLTELHKECETAEIWEFSDSEEEEEDKTE